MLRTREWKAQSIGTLTGALNIRKNQRKKRNEEDMKLTIGMIADLKPCESRFNNFKEHYPDYEGDFRDFLALENITYEDKVWVATRVLTKNQLVPWSIFCAESVKHIFENKYPDNKCLTVLLDYLKNIPDFNNLSAEVKEKIWKLRKPAYDAATAATAAAHAATATAAYAADTAAYAAVDAAYAATAATAAAHAAAYAAVDAAYANAVDAREEQQNLNLLFLASLIEE